MSGRQPGSHPDFDELAHSVNPVFAVGREKDAITFDKVDGIFFFMEKNGSASLNADKYLKGQRAGF